MGGLRTNIEARVLQEFDATDADSVALITERKTRQPVPAGSSANRDLDTIPKMTVKTNPIAVPKPAAPPAAFAAPAPVVAAPAAAPAPLPLPVEERWAQVWESKGLTRRHLNIPDGDNTNPTGSMLMGVGAWDGIDKRH